MPDPHSPEGPLRGEALPELDVLTNLSLVQAHLTRVLGNPLPGPEAQRAMSPLPRPGWKPGHIPEAARRGAALLLLFERIGVPHLLLTVRSADLPHHRGQVSLPGGMVEPGESLEQAALREAHEEVGLEPHGVILLGRLTPVYIPVSGFVLHPVVAVLHDDPPLAPHEAEVARILAPPLELLADPSRVAHEPRTILGVPREVPFFHVDGEKVWGATAMVLAEFLTLLGRPPATETRSSS